MSVLSDILDASGTDVHHGSTKGEVTVCCPFPGCNDARFRLGINTISGAAHCFNCGFKAKGVIYLARQLCKVYGLSFRDSSSRVRKEAKQIEQKKVVDVQEDSRIGLPSAYETFRSPDVIGKQALAWLRRRQVSLLQIVRHQIGYAAAGEMAWRVLFPVIGNDREIHGCVGRDFSGKQTIKYLNTPGIKMLWNAQRLANTAIVVEGVMDALRVETALLQMRDAVAVARLGSAITSTQLDQLKEYPKVIVIPDCDRAGVHGAIELCTRCDSRGIDTHVYVPPAMSDIDPGMMSESEIIDCIKDSIRWSKTAEFKLRAAAMRTVGDDWEKPLAGERVAI